jgi:carbonic anhydrase
MGVIDGLVDHAGQYSALFRHPALPARPGLKVAVLTCMDARIDPAKLLGLRPGDAHVLRNAGGALTPDMLRSLVISQRLLGTEAIAVIRHTGCGVIGLDESLLDHLSAEVGRRPDWQVHGFADLVGDLRTSLAQLRADPFLAHTDQIRGFIYDLYQTGQLTEVTDISGHRADTEQRAA